MKRRQAVIVADLGFGDAGKGTMTDWLVRRLGAGLVVRYNGGAQAGHTVVTASGLRHTFAQLGAGTFVPGVRTHLSRFMVLHPGGLLVEAEALANLGVRDSLQRLSISPAARVITPFQQAACRLREVARGADRHGSCGVGVGEAVQDALEHPEDGVQAGELGYASTLRRKLARQQARKYAEFCKIRAPLAADPTGAVELAVLESASAAEQWIASAARLAEQVRLAEDDFSREGNVVFEGAQGVLLDEWRGFHPHTTWSTCTFANALAMLERWDGEIVRMGVLRSYATRHGAGPFPTEDSALQIDEPHNVHGPWQGPFRLGWPDAVLARYAVACCQGVDALAVTHLDRVPGPLQMATDYDCGELAPGPFQDLAYQEGLTRTLQRARPNYQPCVDVGEELSRQVGVPLWIRSYGPRAEDKVENFPCGLLPRPVLA